MPTPTRTTPRRGNSLELMELLRGEGVRGHDTTVGRYDNAPRLGRHECQGLRHKYLLVADRSLKANVVTAETEAIAVAIAAVVDRFRQVSAGHELMARLSSLESEVSELKQRGRKAAVRFHKFFFA